MTVHVDAEALRAAGVRLLVLFGSAARGHARPGSDVDLGVLVDGDGRDPWEVVEAVAGAVGAGSEPDIVVLDEADPLLLYEVAVDGRPLFETEPGTFEAFRVRAIGRYLDTAWIRRLEAEALRQRYR